MEEVMRDMKASEFRNAIMDPGLVSTCENEKNPRCEFDKLRDETTNGLVLLAFIQCVDDEDRGFVDGDSLCVQQGLPEDSLVLGVEILVHEYVRLSKH